MSTRVVLASANPGKLVELQAMLAPLDLELESQAEHDVPSPVEDGLTFLENAIIKARAVSRATNLPAIGDDSGIVVPVLDGAPGIYSARYAGTHGDDAANNAKLLDALVSAPNRAAYFYCAIVYLRHADDPTPLISTAAWHGQIASAPSGGGGFGYDPLFVPEGGSATAAELEPAAKNRVSHRGQAVAGLVSALRAADVIDA